MFTSSIPKPRTASFALHISTSSGGASTSALSSSLSPSSGATSPSNLGRVPLDARVVLSRRRAGYVRFMGKLKSESGEWYGVALDEAKGDNDGSWLGDRLFTCAPGHGVFVRRKEIFYIKEQANVKSPPSPVTNDSEESSNTSVSSQDSSEPPTPSYTNANTPDASALQRTFKSFRRVLQSPMKLGESVANALVSPPQSSASKVAKRASLIPPPAVATARHQSFAPSSPDMKPVTASSPRATESLPVESASSPLASLFAEADTFASMTRALAEQNNTVAAPATVPQLPALPPQIDVQQGSDVMTTTTPSPRRLSPSDRRHSTFAFGSSTVSSAAATAAANAVRIVELEKEIVTMRTNHENVVAVLRATNKQHAANVLELRAQVAGLTDGNSYLQKQLSTKSAQLIDAKLAERTLEYELGQLKEAVGEKDMRIAGLETDVASLQIKLDVAHSEHHSVLVDLQRQFQLRSQRDRRQIDELRQEVVAMCNERNAVQRELRESNELTRSFFF